MSIEYTAENKMRNGERLLDRLADTVDHEKSPSLRAKLAVTSRLANGDCVRSL
jgi:hypothetical protein